MLGIAAATPAGGVRLTLKSDCEGSAMRNATLATWGRPMWSPFEQACVDSKHRMISAPAYMYGDANLAGVFASIQAAVKALDGYWRPLDQRSRHRHDKAADRVNTVRRFGHRHRPDGPVSISQPGAPAPVRDQSRPARRPPTAFA